MAYTYRLPCSSCGFMSCEDRVQCEKDARFDIDRALRNGVYWPSEDAIRFGYGQDELDLAWLVEKATELLSKYFDGE